MMSFKSTLVLMCLTYTVIAQEPTTTRRPTRFTIKCGIVQSNEILFDGACHLGKYSVYNKITEIVELIQSSDQSMTLNEFLRNELFKNSTAYFEDQYKDRPLFIQKLNSI